MSTATTHNATKSAPNHHVSSPSRLQTALSDIAKGCAGLTHKGMALAGLTLVIAATAIGTHPELRQQGEQALLVWLQNRHSPQVAISEEPLFVSEPAAAQRATALPTADLPKQQANVAFWLSHKYREAPEPLGVLVAEAFAVGSQVRLDPTLLLAVMAIESRFNPFAQSPVGAQGLMQVLTKVHTDKYDQFGGQLAAFDPVSNLRVGARVLHDCVKRAGSVQGGLRLYVGAVSSDGSGYINKVMDEHLRIQSVAQGKPMPTVFPVYRSTPEVDLAPSAPSLQIAENSVMSAAPIGTQATPVSIVNTDTAIEPQSSTETPHIRS